ncbi:MAG TPA: oligosaccharide flippase family protein [Solirubrobacteraceae bacterium]|nr:oligosaccharide flippase family protein [Solirubrobacteraceae bacterium]
MPGNEVPEQERYAHGLKYSLYDTLTSLALGLVSAIVTARVFGAEVIGAFALASLLTGSLHMVSNVREQGGLVRELTRHAARAPESRALLLLVLGFSVALTLAVLIPFGALSVWLLREVFDQPDLVGPFAVLVAAYLLLDNTSFNLDAPLVAYRDGRSLWIVRTAITATMIIGALGCAVAGEKSLWALVLITVAASAVGVVLRVLAVRRLTGLRSSRRAIAGVRDRLRPIVWFGIRQAPLNYTETAIEYTDTAVLGASVPLVSVGAYSRAYTLYRRAGQVPIALSRLYFPTLTALFHRGEHDAMLRVHRLSTRYLTLLLLPAATWLAASAPAVLDIFGPGFDAGATALSILIFAIVLDGYGRMAGGYLAAFDRPGIVSIVSLGTAVLNVALCLALIPSLELTGAALANVAGWLFMAVALVVIAARQAGRPAWTLADPGFLLRLVAACAVLAAAAVALRGAPVALLWQCLVALPALAAGLVVFRPLSRADEGAVERALDAAGVQSARLRRAVRSTHSRIAHGQSRS